MAAPQQVGFPKRTSKHRSISLRLPQFLEIYGDPPRAIDFSATARASQPQKPNCRLSRQIAGEGVIPCFLVSLANLFQRLPC